MKTAIFKAEDVPAYMFDPKADKPWRDEDVAMSAPRTLAKDQAFSSALDVMAEHLRGISVMNHVVMAGEAATYALAAAFFESAKTRRFPAELGVQISGRVYRVREQ